MEDSELLHMAIDTRANAHAPYSRFEVGAAVIGESGNVYTGCNVESNSFGLSMCAERVAIFKAISQGEKRITKVAISANQREKCVPCGACLHIIGEFGPDCTLVIDRGAGEFDRKHISDLLPERFCL